MSGIVDFILEDGNIRAVLEDVPTQGKALQLQERKIREKGFEPVYLDIIRYLKVLEMLEQNGPMTKKEISRAPNLSKAFKEEIKRYYKSPLTELRDLGILEMIQNGRRYTSYKLTDVGVKALEDYRESKGAPIVGTNFKHNGDWLLPIDAYK